MTVFTSQKVRTLAQRIDQERIDHDRRIAKMEAEAKAENARLDAAFAKAGRSRFALVEDLLERFHIPPAEQVPMINKRTKEPIRDREGNVRTQDTDKDETQRMERLREALTAALQNATSSHRATPTEQH